MRSYYKAGGSRIRYDSRFETQLFPRVRCQLLPEDWQLAEDQKDIADMLNTEFENAVHTSSTKEDVMSKMTAVIIKLYPRILPDGPGRVVDRLVRATFEGIGVLFLFTEGFMRSVFLAVCVLCGFAGVAEAQKVSAYAYYSETSTAQGVAEMQARTGRCQHFGNPTGGYEGVGFSTAGPEQAKRNCCYWGQRKPRDIGVARGPRGWFACVRYH
jgi:hypothetical protein